MPWGLSPRVRGSLAPRSLKAPGIGSIPACAGEPVAISQATSGCGVYPRVCGGACRPALRRCMPEGLSPRVRGSRQPPRLQGRGRGSIPACAGEPPTSSRTAACQRVYPRVCGGALSGRKPRLKAMGLSPRVRGSHDLYSATSGIVGSIPACAGEPSVHSRSKPLPGVYPRVCGGAAAAATFALRHVGLSPRVRGSRIHSLAHLVSLGSIPACAGEPPSQVPSIHLARVYPRVCGGAPVAGSFNSSRKGLSPRVRGSRKSLHQIAACTGSIPACAGEPLSSPTSPTIPRVYPRVCGGATYTVTDANSNSGLSPRVRGSPKATV